MPHRGATVAVVERCADGPFGVCAEAQVATRSGTRPRKTAWIILMEFPLLGRAYLNRQRGSDSEWQGGLQPRAHCRSRRAPSPFHGGEQDPFHGRATVA